MNAKSYIDLENTYGAHNYHPLDVVIDRGEGVWVWDVDGNRYLDCLSAYSALNQGHRHPKIIQALTEQAQRVTLTSRAFRNDQLGLFYKALSELSGYEMALPMNTGAEAVETALKLARKWGYAVKGIPAHQAEIITLGGNFHGRTITIISFSSEPSYKEPFGPLTPGFVTVPYGDARALEQAITPNTAAVLLEPIQGEAGVVMPPAGYLRQVAEVCRRHNVLLMADEIQTGLGRTGKLFASQHEDVRPDVMILGKALGGGVYPVSAVLEVIVEEKLVENSARLGEYFQERLAELPSRHVQEVRGKGLFIGVELKPEAGGARRFCEALQTRGVLCKETHDNVIRFAPPLIIDQPTIDWALEPIADVLGQP